MNFGGVLQRHGDGSIITPGAKIVARCERYKRIAAHSLSRNPYHGLGTVFVLTV